MTSTTAPATLLASLLLAALAPGCVGFLDPLAPFEEDAGAGDAGSDDASDASLVYVAYVECEAGTATLETCGNCGTMTVSCLLGAWAYGPCVGEGVCTWGDQETCGASGDGTRVCQASCKWGGCSEASETRER